MKVCLVRKLADCIDGVDIAPYRVGDEIELPERQARLLLLEGWAVNERRLNHMPRAGPERRVRRASTVKAERHASAADASPKKSPKKRMREKAAKGDKQPNLHYDDCEERESRIAETLKKYKAKLRGG